jgi:hypothetical protein
MKTAALSLPLVLALVVGCGDASPKVDSAATGSTEPSWQRVMEQDLTPAQHDQLQRAVVAQQEMAHTMMGELKSELEGGSPAGAVVVCRDLAPMIADHVSTEHGLIIGRTSHRLRNPGNTAPEWVSVVVDEGFEMQATFEGPKGELGVTLPIRMAAQCLACHGPAESLSDEITLALTKSYPEDQATGFAEGDLRGWFWIEVPAQAGTSDS